IGADAAQLVATAGTRVGDHDCVAHSALRRTSGMSGMLAAPVGFQSDTVAPCDGWRLSGGPIGCGVALSLLMRAATFGSIDSNGIAIRAKLSAPRLASSSFGHDWRGNRDRRAQMVAAIDQHDASKGQAVPVIERMIALTITIPPPFAQAAGGRGIADNAESKAHFMGTSGALVGNPSPG